MAGNNEHKQIRLDIEGREANNTLQALIKKARELAQDMAKASQIGDTSKLNKLRKEYHTTLKEVENMTSAQKAFNVAISNMNITDYRELLHLQKKIKAEMMKSHVAQGSKEWKAYEAQLNQVNAKIQQFKSEMDASSSSSGILSRGLSALGLQMGGLYLVVSNIKRAFSELVSVNMEFEQSNANLASVLGKSTSEITDLTDQAKLLGETTMYTASQVSGLQVNLAKLGFKEGQIQTMTKDILNFATATGAQLPEAASVAGSALRAFDLPAEEMSRVVSTMAVATTKSALDFEKLRTSISITFPIAKSFGFTIEDTVALLGKLSDAGFEASSAATATRNIFLNMANPAGKLAKALGEPIRSLDDLAPALQKLKERGISLNETFAISDRRSSSALSTFISKSGELTDIRDEITGCQEALQDMVDTRMDTLQGDVYIMKSAWQGLLLSFDESNSVMRKTVQWLTRVITSIREFFADLRQDGHAIDLLKVSLTLVVGALKLLANITGSVISYLVRFAEVFSPIAIAMGIHVGWQKLIVLWNTKIITSLSKLKAAFIKNPFTAFAAAISSVIALVLELTDSSERAAEEMKEWKEHVKSLKDVTKDLNDEFGAEKVKIRELQKIIHDDNNSIEVRRGAIEKLKNIVKDYNAEISNEGKLIKENTNAVSEYLQQRVNEIKLELYAKKIAELQEEQRKKQIEINEESARWQSEYAKAEKEYMANMLTYLQAGMRPLDLFDNQGISDNINKLKSQLTDLKNAELDLQTAADSIDLDSLFKKTGSEPDSLSDQVAKIKQEMERQKQLEIKRYDALVEINKGNNKKLEELAYEHEDNMYKITQDGLHEIENVYKGSDTMAGDPKKLAQVQTQIEANTTKHLTNLQRLNQQYGKKDLAEMLKLENMEMQSNERRIAANKKLADANANDAYTIAAVNAETDVDRENAKIALNRKLYENEVEYYRQLKELYRRDVSNLEITDDAKVQLTEQYASKRKEAEANIEKAQGEYLKSGVDKYFKVFDELESKTKKYDGVIVGEEKWRQRQSKAIAALDNEKKAIDSTYTEQVNMLKEMQDIELDNTELTEEQRLAIEERYEQLREQLDNKYNDAVAANAKAKNATIEANNRETFKHVAQVIEDSISKAKELLSGYGEFVSADYDLQIAKVESRYEKEIEAAEKMGRDTTKLEQQRDEEVNNLKLKQLEAEYKINLAQSFADAASASIKVWANPGYPMAIPLQALIAAQQAMTIATLTKQFQTQKGSLKGFSEGGYTGDGIKYHRVAGVVHDGEFVANHNAVNNPSVRPVLDAIDYAQRNNTISSMTRDDVALAAGFANGGYTSGQRSVGSDNGSSAINRLVSVLSSLEQNGIVAINTMSGRHGVVNSIKKYDKLRSNAKR